MITCLFCNKRLKTKKAFKTHEESKTHKENTPKDSKDLFVKSLISLIYKYDEFRKLEFVYKEFMQKFNFSYKMAGFKCLSEIDFQNRVLLRTIEGVCYVKGHGNFLEEEPPITLNIPKSRFNQSYL